MRGRSPPCAAAASFSARAAHLDEVVVTPHQVQRHRHAGGAQAVGVGDAPSTTGRIRPAPRGPAPRLPGRRPATARSASRAGRFRRCTGRRTSRRWPSRAGSLRRRACAKACRHAPWCRGDEQLQRQLQADVARARIASTAASVPPALSPPTASRVSSRPSAAALAASQRSASQASRRRWGSGVRARAGSRAPPPRRRCARELAAQAVVGLQAADDEAAAVQVQQQRQPAVRRRVQPRAQRGAAGGRQREVLDPRQRGAWWFQHLGRGFVGGARGLRVWWWKGGRRRADAVQQPGHRQREQVGSQGARRGRPDTPGPMARILYLTQIEIDHGAVGCWPPNANAGRHPPPAGRHRRRRARRRRAATGAGRAGRPAARGVRRHALQPHRAPCAPPPPSTRPRAATAWWRWAAAPASTSPGVAIAATHEGPLKTYATIEGGSPKISERVAPLIRAHHRRHRQRGGARRHHHRRRRPQARLPQLAPGAEDRRCSTPSSRSAAAA